MNTIALEAAGYRFIPGMMQYSGGVAALPGYRLERARFAAPVPLAEGWRRIAAHLATLGRPLAAFAACELRSPAPFTDEGFMAFNRGYATVLHEWGAWSGERNPVARSNVCPRVNPPAMPSFHAFTYAMPADGTAPSFVVSGSGESHEGRPTYAESTVALGDTSPSGMLAKGRFVLGEMERRLGLLGFGWADTTGVQAYTVHPLPPELTDEIVTRGAARHGLTWHDCRPPIEDLDYEMDCRGIAQEHVLPA